MTQSSRPGWYPDPEGKQQLRWWDGQQWTSSTNPLPSAPSAQAPPDSNKGINWKWALGTIAVIALVIGVGVNSEDDDSPTTRSASSASSSQSQRTTLPARTSTQAEIDAAAERQRVAAEASAAQEAARLDRSSYAAMDDREYAMLVKDPDSFTGRRIVVFGDVTQFDSATGTSQFRANTAASPQEYSFEYDTNTVIEGHDSAVTANVVKDDLVTMYVEVKGSLTYDTTLGGSMTVPQFTAHIIDVTGSSG